MKKVWIAFSIITVGTVIFLCAYRSAVYSASMALLETWHLLPRHEQYTELYFYNIIPVTETGTVGETHFSFVIRNVEGRAITYRYHIYLQAHGTSRLLESGTVPLDDDMMTRLVKTFRLRDLSGNETISVVLPDFDQQIHFRLFPNQ